jgi:hypothetical protein
MADENAGSERRSEILRFRLSEPEAQAFRAFCAKPGADKQAFMDAARATLAKEFAGHEYVFVILARLLFCGSDAEYSSCRSLLACPAESSAASSKLSRNAGGS